MSDTAARDRIATLAKSLFERGLTFGASGNISVRVDDGWLMTPTGSSMAEIDPERISRLDAKGNWLSGDKPTKEAFLHMAMYEQRSRASAVVHLHSTHSVAVSCLDGLDAHSVLPPITAYFVMRVGRLPLVDYYAPGDPALADAVRDKAAYSHALLLANHGPVVAGATLEDAVQATEELEETAKLFLLLRGEKVRALTSEQVRDLEARFPSKV